MQHLFSMFPSGWPGRALVLLRISVAFALMFESYAHRGELSVWVLGLVCPILLGLLVGLLTPVFAMLALVFHASIWIGLGADSVWLPMVISLDTIALALLGPGAYSVDSYRFGRRVVVLPPP